MLKTELKVIFILRIRSIADRIARAGMDFYGVYLFICICKELILRMISYVTVILKPLDVACIPYLGMSSNLSNIQYHQRPGPGNNEEIRVIKQSIKLFSFTAEEQRPQRIDIFSFAVERPAKENLPSALAHCGRRPQDLWGIGFSPILHKSGSSQRSQHLERVHVSHGRVGGEMG